MPNRRRVVQQATFDAVELPKGPAGVRATQLRRGRQERLLLGLENQHEAAEGVEQEARVFHALRASLMLLEVERHPQVVTQIHPPLIEALSLRKRASAHDAAPDNSEAGRVPRHRPVEREVVDPHNPEQGPRGSTAQFPGSRTPEGRVP